MADNGVSMPGPMSSGYEDGWNLGVDLSGVSGFSGSVEGVQLPGGPDEQGWGYGQDMSGLAPHQAIPVANDFGVQEGMSPRFDSDDAQFGSVIGRMPGSNYDGVQPGDIQQVFHQVTSNGGPGGLGEASGYDSMRGIG